MIRQTAVVTAASIAGVILAGGAAVGANIGILSAADDSNLGQLSAEAPITTPLTGPVSSLQLIEELEGSSDTSQSFTVDLAGEAEVSFDDKGLHLSDVRVNQGWSWQEQPNTDGAVIVLFSSESDELIFTATKKADGTITASVERPVVTSATPAPTPTVPTSVFDDDDDDDDDEYEEYEEYDDDDEEHEEYEHEGREDDD